MRILIYISILFLALPELSIAQDQTLEDAVLLYRKRDYPAALEVIDKLKNDSTAKNDPNVWNNAMLINDKMMSKSYTFQDTTKYVLDLIEAYHKCQLLDKDHKYTHKTNALMKKKVIFFKYKADFELKKGETSEYYKAQKLYILCLEGHGKSSVKAHLNLARTYRDNKNYQEALVSYNAVIQRDYEPIAMYQEAITMMNKANKRGISDSLFAVVLTKYPDDVSFKLIEINDLVDRSLYFKARSTIRDLIASNPDNIKNGELQYLMGLSNMRLNLSEDAIASLNNCLSIDPNHFNANFESGKYYFEQGLNAGDETMLKQAKIALEKCEYLQPDNEEILSLLRDLYLETRDMTNYQRINNKLEN